MKPGFNKRVLGKSGQVCLETAIALVLLLAFITGAAAVFKGMQQ